MDEIKDIIEVVADMQLNDCNKLRKLFEVKLGTRGMCNANDIEECRDNLLTVSNARLCIIDSHT